MLAFSIDYYGIFFGATQSVELFCTYLENIYNIAVALEIEPYMLLQKTDERNEV